MYPKQAATLDATDGTQWVSLVGKFFHELGKDGYADRQGKIVSEPYPQVFFVRHFDWLTGSSSWNLRLYALADILQGQWRFYLTDDDMRETYQYGGLSRPP